VVWAHLLVMRIHLNDGRTLGAAPLASEEIICRFKE